MKKKIERYLVLIVLLFITASLTVSSSFAAQNLRDLNLLKVALAQDIMTLDPGIANDIESSNIISHVYEGLFTFRKDSLEIEPCLAESYEISEDGKTYLFHLRKNVKFHDGSAFNADAVKINIERYVQNLEIYPFGNFVYGNIKTCEIIDEFTIKIVLKKANSLLPYNLAVMFAAPIVSPKLLSSGQNQASLVMSGTGPFKFMERTRGSEIILIKNENYWGNKAKLDGILFKIIPEMSSRVIALRNGEVDVITSIDAHMLFELNKSKNIIIDTSEGLNTNCLYFNFRKGSITTDKEVRKFITSILDVPEIVKLLYRSDGLNTAADSYTPHSMNGNHSFAGKIKMGEQEFKKENKRLSDITAHRPIRIISYSGNRFFNSAGGVVLAEAIQSALSKYGIKSDISIYDWTTYLSALKNTDWDVAFKGWYSDNGQLDNYLFSFESSDPLNNVGLWNNKKFNYLIEQASVLNDPLLKLSLYNQAEELLFSEHVVIPISHAKQAIARSSAIQGVELHPLLNVRFTNAVKY